MRKLFASRARKVGALTVAGLLAFGGIALAVLVLTSSFSGQATADVTQLQASDEITNVRVDSESGMDCTVSNIAPESFTLDASVSGSTVTDESGNTQTKEPVAGSCVVSIDILNTGDVALEAKGAALTTAPQGWSIGNFSFSGAGGTNATFQPGETLTVTGTLSADDSAQSGALEGTVSTQTKS